MRTQTKRWLQTASIPIALASAALHADVVQVRNSDIQGKVTWTRNNTYVLNGFVYVEAGEELHIEAGTVIQGNTNTSPADIAALVVARGGKIFAEGTPQSPIIFTSVLDDVFDPEDVGPTQRGLWGGIVLLGNAPINRATDAAGNAASPKYEVYEGLKDIQGTGGQFLHRFGGADDHDSSGILRYVSIRHGGRVLESNKEINGLSLCGVGDGTTVEFVEAYAIADDGFEFFGGTVNTRYLISAFNDDDAFDVDMGHRGKHQFWFSIQAPDARDKGGELNGEPNSPAPDPNNPAKPTSQWEVYNWTCLGAGAGTGGANNNALNIRDFAAPNIHNSIFADFAQRGVSIDATAQLNAAAGLLNLSHNYWWNFSVGNAVDNSVTNIAMNAAAKAFFDDAAKANRAADPKLRGISRTTDGALDPRLAPDSPARSGAKATPDGYLAAAYHGAFADNLWASQWSALYAYGIITPNGGFPGNPVVQVRNSDIQGKVTWTRNNTYVLNGFVYVESGEELHIEAGTVIQGNTNASPADIAALVVARGGKIFAEGTPQNPIIFTSVLDDVSDPEDVGPTQRGLWGGIVLLGNAPINRATDAAGNAASPKYEVYEGLKDIQGTGGQFLHRFGGADDHDSSGILRYVSIRHGGRVLESNKEINGLSLCGVGDGTTVEFVEAYAIADDGFEFFGGTVNTRYLISAFNDDDAFDVDMGHRGKHQFWFSIQAPDARDKGGELNGEPNSPAPDPNNPAKPTSQWEVYNWTCLGAGAGTGGANNNALNIRDFAAPNIHNSIFADFAQRGVSIDATAQLNAAAGLLNLSHNYWWNFSVGNAVDNSVANIAMNAAAKAFFDDAAKANFAADPKLRGISRTTDGALDPRLAPDSPARSGAKPAPAGYWAAEYHGAFRDVNWLSDWSALGRYNIASALGAGTPIPAAIAPPADTITLRITPSSSSAVIRHPTKAGKFYSLEYRNALDTGAWINERTVPGDGAEAVHSVPFNAAPARYYRVTVQ